MLALEFANSTVIVNSMVSGLLLGSMLALIALGLSIILGVMRLLNLAHGELLIAGAYLEYFLLLLTGCDPLLSLPVVGGATAGLALLLHRVLIRPLSSKGADATMMTMLGVSIILQNFYVLAFHADTRAIDTAYAAQSVHWGSITVAKIYVIGFGLSVISISAVHQLIMRTAFGRDLRAASSDPFAAAVVGVDVDRVRALTFALGAACAAMGGVLIGTAFAFSPSSGTSYLLSSFTVVAMGGIGNVFGTLLAGMVLGLVQSTAALTFGDGYRDFAGLILLLVFLTLRPRGFAAAGAS
ncbi:branched-chain amino acid ABC transporter permease [Trinickia sp. LjRoot230]|uniref:branched-chain amino acid ABC transporter permease n=1 Tax=Trinickia sp. LjRoot230 TaxID=3342288 RepID=UPI003ECF7398